MNPVDILIKQSSFLPIISGTGKDSKWGSAQDTLATGMGGSGLAGSLLASMPQFCSVRSYSGFDLPTYALQKQLAVIASSASGEVAETLSNFEMARKEKMPLAAVGKGGALLQRAAQYDIPHVIFPDIGVPPRESVVHSLLSHMALLGMHDGIAEVKGAAERIKIKEISEVGDAIVGAIRSSRVLLYGDESLEGVLKVWKINLNETARVPAHISLMPDLLHGEIAAYDGSPRTNAMSSTVCILLFETPETDSRITLRTALLQDILGEYGLKSILVKQMLSGWGGLINSIATSMYVAHTLREEEGISRDGANLIASFKNKVSNSK